MQDMEASAQGPLTGSSAVHNLATDSMAQSLRAAARVKAHPRLARTQGIPQKLPSLSALYFPVLLTHLDPCILQASMDMGTDILIHTDDGARGGCSM
jgi:hypothetical protein